MKLRDDVVLRRIADEYLAIPLGELADETHGIVTLTSTGYEICRLLREEVEIEQIVDKILEQFEVEENNVKEDCIEFIEQLKKLNWLENN